ncbi:MAG TPA: hypothetical protein VGB02_18310 [Pyrinomonadaceae bacterium]|jgi:predicted nucleic acid-binding protein
MKTYFADTGYLLALELGDDQNHQSALAHWTELLKTTFAIVTTSYVFDETITYLNSRNHHKKAVEVGENLLLSPLSNSFMLTKTCFLKGGRCFKNMPIKDIR